MSNIGKQRILIPTNVVVQCKGWNLHVKGRKGESVLNFPSHTKLVVKDNYLLIKGNYINSALYGSLQRKAKALIHGLNYDYNSNLKFVGIGYRPVIENSNLVLRLGYSHEISVKIPSNLKVNVVKRTNLKIYGSNYEEVRNFAFKIRKYRRPEPYKGKGIVVDNEIVRRKEGKKKKT